MPPRNQHNKRILTSEVCHRWPTGAPPDQLARASTARPFPFAVAVTSFTRMMNRLAFFAVVALAITAAPMARAQEAAPDAAASPSSSGAPGCRAPGCSQLQLGVAWLARLQLRTQRRLGHGMGCRVCARGDDGDHAAVEWRAKGSRRPVAPNLGHLTSAHPTRMVSPQAASGRP